MPIRLRPLADIAGLSAGRVAGYLLLYFALAWVSFVYPMRGLNITPWNPQAGLAVGLLLWRPRSWWLVWAAAAAGEELVASEALSWPALLVASGLQTAGYAAIAAALRRWLAGTTLPTRRDLVTFFLIVACGALLGAVLRAAALAAFDAVPPDRVPAAIYRVSIGDGVGLLVMLPLLLLVGNRERRAAGGGLLRSREWWLIVLVTAAGVLAVFGRPPPEQFKFFYLLFVPVVWAAARFGVAGAVWTAALLQAMVMLAVQSGDYRALTVFELQLLMAALAATGLLLGAVVEEREEAARELRASLRLAAAGDMAAALAHELNQPLTAISTYARAAQLLAGRVADENRALAEPLLDVTGKLADEASRAGMVVKRLRNFFRDRATELQPTSLQQLLDEALRAQALRAQALAVRLDVADDTGGVPVWVDRVQVGVVLRNLVANAIDAATDARRHDAHPRWVAVRARCQGDTMLVAVTDSGAGLASADDLVHVFERRGSDKPGGMGMGLAISRSMVEAHGGRLWAERGPGGRFCFTLPLAAPEPRQ